jgi:DNA-binding SARP family transcriptional activator
MGRLLGGATSPRPAPELRIKALGEVQVWRGERELVAADFVYAKTRELLLYLLNSRAKTKEQICLALWPDADLTHAHMRFRVVLYHLRRALGRPDWILRSQNLYSFNRSREGAFVYDVDVFQARVAEAEQLRTEQPRRAIGLLEAALALYEGEYAESLGATDWTTVQQDALRQRYHTALLTLASLQFAEGEVRLSLATYQKLIVQDKYAEEAQRGVIQCYVQLHDFSQAVEHYQQLCAMFEAELGIVPAPETRAALQPMQVSLSPL